MSLAEHVKEQTRSNCWKADNKDTLRSLGVSHGLLRRAVESHCFLLGRALTCQDRCSLAPGVADR